MKILAKILIYAKVLMDCAYILLKHNNNIKYLIGTTDKVQVTDTIILPLPEKTIRKRISNLAKIKRCLDNGWVPVDVKNNGMIVLENKEEEITIIQNNFDIILEDFMQTIDKASENVQERGNVIDVGGFLGETAVMFARKGYKKVFVFEPVCEGMQYILENIRINNLEDRVVPVRAAVADRDSKITITSSAPPLTPGFGLKNTGEVQYRIETDAISWKTLLKDIKNGKYGKVSLVKVDCEGCEEHLATVPENLLQTVPVWIVETHRKDIYEKIVGKFKRAGFEKAYEKYMGTEVKLTIFRSVKDKNTAIS